MKGNIYRLMEKGTKRSLSIKKPVNKSVKLEETKKKQVEDFKAVKTSGQPKLSVVQRSRFQPKANPAKEEEKLQKASESRPVAIKKFTNSGQKGSKTIPQQEIQQQKEKIRLNNNVTKT